MEDIVSLVFTIGHNDISPVIFAMKKRNKKMLTSIINCYRNFCCVLDSEGEKARLHENREAQEILQSMFFKTQQQISLAIIVLDCFEDNTDSDGEENIHRLT